MEIAYQILVLLHLIGWAALFGGCLVQARAVAPEVNAAMLHGGWVQLVTGLALTTLLEVGPEPVNHVKVGIKLVVTLFLVLLLAKNRKFTSIPRGLWALVAGLTLANAGLAVLWDGGGA